MSYLFVHSDVSYGFTFLNHTSKEKVGHKKVKSKQNEGRGGTRERMSMNQCSESIMY